MAKSRNRYNQRKAKERRNYKELLHNQELIDEYQQGLTEPDVQLRIPDKFQRTGSSVVDSDNDEALESWMSEDNRKWYVLDTNLILSCVDILYDATDKTWRQPLNFRPALDNAHLIIPDIVCEELNQENS